MNDSFVENRTMGAPRTRFLIELFGNTAVFPIANLVFEMLTEGVEYFRQPDMYTILASTFIQAYFLSRWQNTPHPRRFLGNMIAPTLYTMIEALLEGPKFFAAPHHLAYLLFAFIIGALQSLPPRLPNAIAALALLLENVLRANILFFMYVLFEVKANPAQTISIGSFFQDTSHQFMAIATFLLGLGAGLANLTSQRYLGLLRQTFAQLRLYSEWLLGRDLLNRMVANPDSLALTRQERTILFMDIRGFTAWSDTHPPEEVAALLNEYYHLAEVVFSEPTPLKFKFTADEIMAVYVSTENAIKSAFQLRSQLDHLLADRELGVGIGLHAGPVAEGLLGSSGVKFYDVIGDTVNVAKRIETNALRNEILVSGNIYLALKQGEEFGDKRAISVKGKPEPLIVYSLERIKRQLS